MIEWMIIARAGSRQVEMEPVTFADTDALLNWLYLKIGCESIQTVRISRDVWMIVDEEFLFKNPMPELNALATLAYRQPIYGHAVFCTEVERDGEPDLGGFDSLIEAAAVAKVIGDGAW